MKNQPPIVVIVSTSTFLLGTTTYLGVPLANENKPLHILMFFLLINENWIIQMIVKENEDEPFNILGACLPRIVSIAWEIRPVIMSMIMMIIIMMIMIMMMMNMLLISKNEGDFEDDDFTPWGVKQLFPYAFWFETPRTMPASFTDLNIMIEIIIVMTLMIMVMIITIMMIINALHFDDDKELDVFDDEYNI